MEEAAARQQGGGACSTPAAPAAGPSYDVTDFTEEDGRWLKEAQSAKLLDPGVHVVGVGARHPTTRRPTVLVCYPLRVAHDPRRAAEVGFSTHKWNSKSGSSPVPWPNTFWLVCPEAVTRVGTLEHQGLIQSYQARVSAGEPLAAFAPWEEERESSSEAGLRDGDGGGVGCLPQMSERALFERQHAECGRYRWSLLSPEDAAFAEAEGYASVLRDCGVGGLRFPTQVKCLHLHYAHFLATGDNLVGSWVQEEIDRQWAL